MEIRPCGQVEEKKEEVRFPLSYEQMKENEGVYVGSCECEPDCRFVVIRDADGPQILHLTKRSMNLATGWGSTHTMQFRLSSEVLCVSVKPSP